MFTNIPGYNGKYKCNKRGIICSKYRVLKGCVDLQGYLVYTLRDDYKKRTRELGHRLVAKTFIDNPNPLEKDHVNHLDGNKKNNHVDNLEWVTQSENMLHAYRVLNRPVFIKQARLARYKK